MLKNCIRRALLVTGALALSAACSATDQTSLAEISDAPSTSEATPAGELVIGVSDEHVLTGSFSGGGHSVDFLVERFDGNRAATFYADDGSLLYRASFTADSEKLELGEHITLQGPRASLFVQGAPRLDAVQVSGDLSTAHSVLSPPEFRLTQQLGQALAGRADVDASLFPGELPIASDSGNGALRDETSGRVEQKSHDPEGCAICHVACSASVLVCVGLTWGPLAFICVPPGIACHIGCGASACQ